MQAKLSTSPCLSGPLWETSVSSLCYGIRCYKGNAHPLEMQVVRKQRLRMKVGMGRFPKYSSHLVTNALPLGNDILRDKTELWGLSAGILIKPRHTPPPPRCGLPGWSDVELL